MALQPNALQQKLPDSASSMATTWLTNARNWSNTVTDSPVTYDPNAFFDNPSEDPSSEFITIERPTHSESLTCRLNYLNDKQQWIASLAIKLTPPQRSLNLNIPTTLTSKVPGVIGTLMPHFEKNRPVFAPSAERDSLKAQPIRLQVSQAIESVLQAVTEQNSLDLVLCLDDWHMGEQVRYLAHDVPEFMAHLRDFGLKAQVVDSCLVVGPETTDAPVASIDWKQFGQLIQDTDQKGHFTFDSLSSYVSSSDYAMREDGLDTKLLCSIYPYLAPTIIDICSNREIPSLQASQAYATPLSYDSLQPGVQEQIRKCIAVRNWFVKPGLGAPVPVEQIEPTFLPGSGTQIRLSEKDDDALLLYPKQDGPSSVLELAGMAREGWSKNGIKEDFQKRFLYKSGTRRLVRLTAETASHTDILLGELQEVKPDQPSDPIPFDQLSASVRGKIEQIFQSLHK